MSGNPPEVERKDTGIMPDSPYRRKLLAERFVPWPLPSHEVTPREPNCAVSDWGYACQRGWVSDQRFARSATETVIKRTNRAVSKKWHALDAKGNLSL